MVSDKTGTVLIITLLLITLITGLAVDFAYNVYIGTSLLANWRDGQKASLLAKSGQVLTSRYIEDIDDRTPAVVQTLTIPVSFDLEDGTELSVTIEDESAKFNINSIIYENGHTNTTALNSLKILLDYLDIDDTLAFFIADWIDPDSAPRAGDSEVNAKNTFLWDIHELMFIRGVDDEVFSKMSPFLTIYGNQMININTAAVPVIMSLNKDITEELAERVIFFRESSPFEDKSHIIQVTGFESIALPFTSMAIRGSDFRVISRAEVNGVPRIIESVLDTNLHIHLWREG